MILRENEHRPDLLATLVEVYFIYHFFSFLSPINPWEDILRRMEILKKRKWDVLDRSGFILELKQRFFLYLILLLLY